MRLLPEVKSIQYTEGTFTIDSNVSIEVSISDAECLDTANLLAGKIYEIILETPDIIYNNSYSNGRCISIKSKDNASCAESYNIVCTPQKVCITGDSPRGAFYGVQTFIQIVKIHKGIIPCFTINDSPDIAHRGFYHDVTRGKVPKLDTLKQLAEKCASYKINELQLYVEHSFAFKNIPELWIDKDPLTAKEILELDKHCRKFHVDLIPSLATFGHMYELLRLKRFEHLNELDILASQNKHDLWDRMAHYTIDPLNSESLALITSMLDEYIPLFSSEYFNICCDETFDLGKGHNSLYAAENGSGRMYVDFLKKIIAVVKRHGKIPMFWGDIVLHHPELINEIPDDVIFLNWAYGADVTEEATRTFSESSVSQYVCPGVSGWSRFANDINSASKNIRKMVQYGKKYNCAGVLNTDWGDCGHVNLLSNSYHGMILGGVLSWNTDTYDSDKDFDSAVSLLEWMDKTGSIMDSARELGSLCFYHFGNFYAWVNGLSCLWNKEDALKSTPINLLEENYHRSVEICKDIRRLCNGNYSDKLLDYNEMIWGAHAISWTIAVLIYKKIREYGQEGNTVLDKDQLNNQCAGLCVEFKRLWRERNKESELFNVVETFKAIIERINVIG